MENNRTMKTPRIGEMAPAFQAITTRGKLNFPNDYRGKWIVFYSYCYDFTPVCTTELMSFESMRKEFEALNTQIIGLSLDSIYSHIAWLRKVKELAWKDMKKISVSFPLIADVSTEIASTYGMLTGEGTEVNAGRNVFIIDKKGKIRAILTYPQVIGRNIKEIKRILQALMKTEEGNYTTPANWNYGEDIMLQAPRTCLGAAEQVEMVKENSYSLDWFLSFKQAEVFENKQEPEGIAYASALLLNELPPA